MSAEAKIRRYPTISPAQKQSIPVFITDANLEGHYNRYCKQIIWPTFHYQVPDNPKFKVWEKDSWEHYIAVNRAFADVIVSQYKRGDASLGKRLSSSPCSKDGERNDPSCNDWIILARCFSIFGSISLSSRYRLLDIVTDEARSDLLEGALGSTLIAFQTQEYARHFVQTCSRILSVEAVEHGCMLDDRLIRISCSPIGIDLAALQKQMLESTSHLKLQLSQGKAQWETTPRQS